MKSERKGILGAGVWFIILTGTCTALPGQAYSAPASSGHEAPASKVNHTDGLGLSYAKSCQAEIFAYYKATQSWKSQHAYTETHYYTSNYTYNSYVPGTTSVHEVVTLCDGYPRVVGRTSASEGPTLTITTTYTNTNPTLTAAPYTGPSPTCFIGPRDCELLQSSWTSRWNAIPLQSRTVGLLAPPCDTSSRPQPNYSTNAQGEQCDNCLVVGHSIRLLYWPVTTRPGVADLCHTKNRETITAAPGADGPKTYVTEGITITSPSVAISIEGLSRVDGCGVTLNKTIIPVAPADVTSVRGARALFEHYVFDFADLNYKCLNSPDEIFISDEGRDDCYQQVPADAYWDGYANWAGLGGQQPPNATIWNNYQPQVLPPRTLDAAIVSIWGDNCYIHPDGVWDPPIALQKGSTIDLPTMPGGTVSHSYTSAASNYVPTQPSPSHAVTTVDHPTPTALPDQTGHQQSADGAGHDHGSGNSAHPMPTGNTAVCTINGAVYTYTTLPDGHHALINPTTTAILNENLPSTTAASHGNDVVNSIYTVNGQTFTFSAPADGAPVLLNGHSTVTLTGSLSSITSPPAVGSGASTRLAAYIASVFSMTQYSVSDGSDGMKSVTLGTQTFAVHSDGSGGYDLVDGTSTMNIGNAVKETAAPSGSSDAASRTELPQSTTGTYTGSAAVYRAPHLAWVLGGCVPGFVIWAL